MCGGVGGEKGVGAEFSHKKDGSAPGNFGVVGVA